MIHNGFEHRAEFLDDHLDGGSIYVKKFEAVEIAAEADATVARLEAEVERLRSAGEEVMRWIEAAHRPPVADQFEHGRMVLVRLHALADLRAALAARSQEGA